MITRPKGLALENLSREASGIRPSSWLALLTGRTFFGGGLRNGLTHVLKPRALALGVSLVLSAALTAAALRLPDSNWLAWISFLPLFVVARSLRPSTAALAGGLWGGCLYFFCTGGPAPVVENVVPAIGSSTSLLLLLIVIPAVYLGLAARPARAIGFKLLTLALGWTLIEVILHLHRAPGAHAGLLAGSHGEAFHLNWLARLLGYICTALLVACVNASLIGILSAVRLNFPPCRSLAESPNVVGHHASQIILAIQSWTLRQAHPRAPPL